jgi:hypothetical protein
MNMETLWGFSWWWCLVPMAFMALIMVGCFFFLLTAGRGGCACHAAMRGGEHERTSPRRLE